MKEKTIINIYQGYAGGIKIEAHVKGNRYILEQENVEEILTRMINLYGYEVSKTKAQKIPRLIINSL
jgi:hypothetical protein